MCARGEVEDAAATASGADWGGRDERMDELGEAATRVGRSRAAFGRAGEAERRGSTRRCMQSSWRRCERGGSGHRRRRGGSRGRWR
jgi:hypothetical protein